MKKDEEKSTLKVTPPAESDSERIEILLRKTSLLRSAAESLERDTEEAASHTPESGHKGEDKATPDMESAKRFTVLELLGTGSMGQVYKAYDDTLKRNVAMKFLRVEDSALLEQFLREARSQARVDHQHICKVYEVGEFEGKTYIAMQYIEGKTLKITAGEMTLEQKVKAMKEVAEGVHAAHKMGLVHRDLKPGNVIVEKTEEGWKPYVMDFGLAREQEAPGATRTGMLVGSPSYMAPEQARGEVHRLDRRTDVYGLGATFYEILSGHPPFEGSTATEVLIKILQEEPKSLRRMDSTVPKDLETIAMKCLEKEPQDRFESARALAEDLARYLEGEPVVARPTSWAYRAVKKVKKYPIFSGLLAASAVLVLTASGIALYTWWRAQEQNKLANEFAQEVRFIEDTLRYVYTSPLHDVRKEEAIATNRLQQLETRVKKMGSIAYGPGNYALGRGYLALHQYNEAKNHLEEAWSKYPYQVPQVAYALGLSMAMIYQRELEEIERIASKEQRETRKKEIEKDYRNPALHYIQEGRAATEAAEYVESMIAFLEKRYEDALKKAEAAFQQRPWLYEIKKLEGDIYAAMATERRDRGDNEGALKFYASADHLYQEAIAKGVSDSKTYEGFCGLETEVMELQIYQTDASPAEAYEKGFQACKNALTANPESSEAHQRMASVHSWWGVYQNNRGEDPRPTLERAIQAGKEALRWSPQSATAYQSLTASYWLKSEYELSQGFDANSSIKFAIQTSEKAIELNPNYASAYNTLGLSYHMQSEYESKRGLDPRSSLDLAVRNLEKAIQINPKDGSFYNNTCLAHRDRALYEMQIGFDPGTSLLRAIENCQKAIEINPNNVHSYINIGIAYRRKAEYEMKRGSDPEALLNRAIQSYQRATQISPRSANLYNSSAVAYQTKTEYYKIRGLEPYRASDLTIQSCKRALELNPNYTFAYINLGKAYETRSEIELERGLNPNHYLLLARTALQKAQEIDSNYSETYLRLGSTELVAAQWNIRRNQFPKPHFEKAKIALQQALRLAPEYAEVHLTMAKLYRWQAGWNLQNKLDPRTDIQHGLLVCEKALAINPQMAEAQAIQGTLYFMKAHAEKNGNTRIEEARRAVASLEKALQMNILLKREYEPILKQAHALL